MGAVTLRARLVAIALVVGALGLIGANVAVFNVVRSDLNRRLDGQLTDLSSRRFVNRLLQRGSPSDAPGRVNAGGPSGSDLGPPLRRPRSPLDIYTELRNSRGRRVGNPIRSVFNDETPPALKLPTSIGAPPSRARIFQARDEAGHGFRVIYREALNDPFSQEPAAGANPVSATPVGLVFGIPTADRDATLHKLRTVQVIASGLALVALAILSGLLVRLGLRPLRRIEESAATIAAGDLSHRIDAGSARTEVGRLSLSLNSMLAQIEGAFAAKDESQTQLRRFVADASHELRTPLTSIRGYAELYRRGAARDGVALDRSMQRIESEATRMTRLVEDMLSLARLEGGRALRHEPVDLHPIVDSIAQDVRAVEPGRPVRIGVVGASLAVGDHDAITQLLTNLVSNARVHTAPGTPIEITVEAEVATVAVSVSDSGPGIPEHEHAQLFQPFFRTDPARSRDRGGAGLGLTIAAEIARRLGGDIAVTSVVGVGSTFRVTLPAALPAASPEHLQVVSLGSDVSTDSAFSRETPRKSQGSSVSLTP